MYVVARIWLYFIALIFGVVGLTSLFAPDVIEAQLQLSAISAAGTGEIRGLYGGGFIAFSLIVLGGLRRRGYSPGLLIAMAMIMGGVVLGRLVSLGFDHEYMKTLAAGFLELLAAVACWIVYQHPRKDDAALK